MNLRVKKAKEKLEFETLKMVAIRSALSTVKGTK